jgi:hypothetical protein
VEIMMLGLCPSCEKRRRNGWVIHGDMNHFKRSVRWEGESKRVAVAVGGENKIREIVELDYLIPRQCFE